jgi:hypothetical protein
MGGCLVIAIEMQPLEKLPPPTRTIILMSLLGILLLGLFIVVAILLGGNWVRKLGKHRRGPSVPLDVVPLRPRIDRETQRSATDRLPVRCPVEENLDDNDTKVIDETKGG